MNASVNVVALANKKDLRRIVDAHERTVVGLPSRARKLKPLWKAGAARPWKYLQRSGLLVDLRRINPKAKFLLFYAVPTPMMLPTKER